jgi:hypothetical protein
VLTVSSTFEEACIRYGQFLSSNGYRRQILWVTSRDVLVTDRRLFYVRAPVPAHNLERVRELFDTAMREQSGVSFSTVCETEHATCCRVWVPADDEERQRAMCPPELKMRASTAESRIRGKEVRSRLLWWYLSLRYGMRQKNIQPLFWG